MKMDDRDEKYMNEELNSVIHQFSPIGLIPKEVYQKRIKINRFNDVREAILRYYNAGLEINTQWIEEYNELLDSINKDI